MTALATMNPASPSTSAAWLRHGQMLEASGRWDAAVLAYDRTIALASAADSVDGPGFRYARAIGWMNRGNALQKIGGGEAVSLAVRAYDEAIALFTTLRWQAEPTLRNSLGAAWMNRGRALQLIRSEFTLALAASSHEHAIEILHPLPLERSSVYRRNLAGAWLNLADVLLGTSATDRWPRARDAANTALELVARHEETNLELADVGLKARRTLVEAIGHLLVEVAGDIGARTAFAGEASDAIDDGLRLARHWAAQESSMLRPLAVRLFQFGAQLYRTHQPHFLAEFLLENVVPSGTGVPAYADDAEFRAIAETALAGALEDINVPRLFHVGDVESEKLAALAHELTSTAQQLRAQPTRIARFPLFPRP